MSTSQFYYLNDPTGYGLFLENESDLYSDHPSFHEFKDLQSFVFDQIMSSCEKTSLDDILSAKQDSTEELILPHVTFNVLAILYSLAYGWKARDRKFGELVANSVHTLLKDCIDAALHSTSSNEMGQSTSSDDILYASDFLKLFLNNSHSLGYESGKLLRLSKELRCHEVPMSDVTPNSTRLKFYYQTTKCPNTLMPLP
ncbi:unnamed protein product [Cylicocyclus nassatus]|uniref:Uncharacterized protein n=1 Tax=Cylicocyclus nassatus TaxID=53992 RepID=A0AA36HBS1_CYLNA|nr:unnamed protein product [Cylicocyclus nassatus]